MFVDYKNLAYLLKYHFVGSLSVRVIHEHWPPTMTSHQQILLTVSGSLVCSRKAENSTRRSLGPAMERPCHAGVTDSLFIDVGGFTSL